MFLSEETCSYLSKNDFSIKRVIQKSEWKKTLILELRKDERKYILKAISCNSPQEIKTKFKIETNFYLKVRHECLPKLFYENSEVIIIENVGDQTLRDYLLTSNYDINFTKNLINSIESLKSIFTENKGDGEIDFSNLNSYISDLTQSGPVQNKEMKVDLLNKLLNKLLVFLLRKRMRKIIKFNPTNDLESHMCHCDFHYNNILIKETGTIHFIDFENIRTNSFFEIDVLYLLTILKTLKFGNDNHHKLIDHEINQITNKHIIFLEIFKTFKTAVSFNPRFTNHPVNFRYKFLVLLKQIKSSWLEKKS